MDTDLIQPCNNRTLWINTWFSSMASIIEGIKAKMPYIKIIATNKESICTYAKIADEFYVEPFGCSPNKYIEFAIEFCKKHKIDIIWPKSYAYTIIENQDIFNANSVGIISENKDAMKLCRSKDATYKELQLHEYNKIPEYYMASNIEDFKTYFDKLISKGNMCLKFDSDEGASSFRIIEQLQSNFESLKLPSQNIITYETAIQILTDNGNQTTFKPIMMMPLLDGPEISVDCYNSPTKGFIAIPRYKLNNRIKEIKFTEEIISDAKEIGNILNLKSAYNIQYRKDVSGNYVLLEVNTRISGGVHMSSLSGFSIPNQLIADSFGIDIQQNKPKECLVTQYEKAILI